MKHKIAALVLGLALALPVGNVDAFVRGGLTTNIPTVTADWKQILVGAGGFFTAMVASNDTVITRLDGPGSYVWNASATAQNGATGTWQPLITTATMPGTLASNPQGFAAGVFEIKMQYGNSNNMYMVYPKWTANTGGTITCAVYSSVNKGATWAETGGYSQNCVPYTDWNGGFRWTNNRMDIDPTNNSNVFLGTQGLGLQYSRNGGSTFTQISTAVVPVGTGEQVSGVLFNPTNHDNLFACVGGSGVYQSANATSATPPTFSLISGGPTGGCLYTDIDRANGNYYAIDAPGQNLWVFKGASWNKILTSTFAGVNSITGIAVDPTTANHVIVCDIFGNLNETFNANAATPTWGGWTDNQSAVGPLTFNYTNDVLWLSSLQNNFQFQGFVFDRSNPHILYFNTRNGAFTTTLPGAITNSTAITMAAMSRGIENLTTLHVLSVPTSPSTVLVSGWDHPIYAHTAANLDTYPASLAGPMQSANFARLCVAWGLDYASSNTSFVGSECDGINAYSGQPAAITASGFSSNDGSTWTNWTSLPTSNLNGGQNVAFSTPSNCLFAPGGGVKPSFSNNCNVAAPTWTQISLPGTPSLTGFLNAPFNPAQEIAADRVNAGWFYLFDPGVGFFLTQNCGTTCTWTAGATNTDFNLTKTPMLKAVPGIAQDVFVAGGVNGPAGFQPEGGFLNHSIDGFATSGNSCQVTSMAQANSVGFGKAASGKTFPAVYATGWATDTSSDTFTIPVSLPSAGFQFHVATGSTYYPVGTAITVMAGGIGGSNNFTGIVTGYNSGTGLLTMTVYNTMGSGSSSSWGVFISGVWENDTFTHASCQPSNPVWTLVGSQRPLKSMQDPVDIDGDMNIYRQAYISLGVQGWAYITP